MIVLLLSHVAAAGEGSSAVVQGNASTFETGGGRTPREVLAQGWGNLDYRVPRRLVPGGGEPRGLYASQHTPFVIRTLRPGETPLPDHQIEERVVKTLVVPRSTNPFGNELTITIDTFAGARIVRFDGHNAPPARRLTRENAGVATFDFAGSSYELNVFDDSLQVRKPRAAWQSARLALKSTVRESVQVPVGLSNVRSAMASLDDAPDVRARHERQTTPPPTRAALQASRESARILAVRRDLDVALHKKDPKVRAMCLKAWRERWSEVGVGADFLDRTHSEMTKSPYPAPGPFATAQTLMHLMEQAGSGRGMGGAAREVAIWRAAKDFASTHTGWGAALEGLGRFPIAARAARGRR